MLHDQVRALSRAALPQDASSALQAVLAVAALRLDRVPLLQQEHASRNDHLVAVRVPEAAAAEVQVKGAEALRMADGDSNRQVHQDRIHPIPDLKEDRDHQVLPVVKGLVRLQTLHL